MPQRRVFVCDSFAVLQDALVTAVASVQDADPLASATVIASSAPLALRLRRAIARAGAGHFGLRVCTLTDFARERAEDLLLQAGHRPLPSLAAPLLIQRFLVDAERDTYFAPLASLPGFPHSVLATLTDLRHAGVSPQRFQTFLDRAPQGEISRQKLASLGALYDRYLRFLIDHGLYDDIMIVERAIEALQSEALRSPLFVYGFHDFTPLQRRFIAATVAERDALVFFPWRPGNAYECATPTLTWLTNLGFHPVSLAGGHKNGGNLARLQTGLFEERSPGHTVAPNKADQSVLFLSAPGKSQEAREIGRVIFQLVQTRGVRFHEIGIFLHEPVTYGPLFVDAFQGLGIPTFLHGGLPLIRTQAGQRFLLLCQVLLEDYARSRVIEFIRVVEPPLSALLGEQAAAARLTQWEAFSVQAGIVKGARAWRDRLARLMRDQPTDEDEKMTSADRQALQALIAFMEGLLTASEQRPQSHSWRGWTDFILRLMKTYVAPTDHTGEVEAALLGLSELDLLNGAISFAEWTRHATTALTSATVSVGALDKEGVFIGDLLAARGLQFRAVIIPGLVEGSFPRMARQDPLLLDQERQYLSEFSAHELRQRRHLSETEQLLFVLAVQSAREWVVFSYPYAEHGGDLAQTPSFFLLRAIEAVSGTPASLADLHAWERRTSLLPTVLDPPSEAVDLIEYHLLSAAHAAASGDSSLLGYLPIRSPFFSSAFHAMRQRWEVERLTAFDGIIEDELVKEKLQQTLFPTGLRLSASALETYARCPFRYFLSAVLGLNQFTEPEQILTLQPRERGALLHEILHDFFTRVRDTGTLSFAREHKTALQHLLRTVTEEHFLKFANSGATGVPLLWEIEQERLRERLSAFLARECETGGEFFPAAFEVRFGASEPEGQDETPFSLFPNGPVRLRLFDGEELALRGRIDRIDLSPDQQRARIVDYKTGKPIRGRFAGGTALQLPLYLYAAHTLWPEKIWESAAYLYVDRERKVDSPVFTTANWESAFAALNEVVTKLVHSLQSGCFAMSPETCFPCPFPLICGRAAARRVARKQSDPRLEALHWVRAVT